jgi:hypothetical protein
MAMWQHMFGVYVWRSVWRCKLDADVKYLPQRKKFKRIDVLTPLNN